MSFTAYRTWVAGETVTALEMNQQIRDDGGVIITNINTSDGSLVGVVDSLYGTASTVTVSGTSSGETTLMSTVIGANKLSNDGMGLSIIGFGTLSTGSMTVKFYFGNTSLAILSNSYSATGLWDARVQLLRSTTSGQASSIFTYVSATPGGPILLSLASSELLNAATTVKFTATISPGSSPAGTITQGGMKVLLERNNA